jgi:hypothetical protein
MEEIEKVWKKQKKGNNGMIRGNGRGYKTFK